MKRNHSWRGRVWILACVGGVAGCGGSSPPPQTPEASSAADAAEPGEDAAPSESQQSASWDGLHSEVESGAPKAPAKAHASQPAGPPAAMAPVPADEAERSLERPATDKDDAKSNKRAESDALAGVGRSADFDDVPSAWTALVSAEARLGKAVELQARDCDSAETYRRAVCDLAGRICSLEDGRPSSGAERRCGDSRARCSAASARYRHVCEP